MPVSENGFPRGGERERLYPVFDADAFAAEKNALVRKIAEEAADFYGFVFLADLHLSKNRMLSAPLVRSILENTPVKDVIVGGDVISPYGDEKRMALDEALFREHYGGFRPYFVRGDHECVIAASDTAESGVLYDRQNVRERFFSDLPDVTRGNGGTYYFFDRPAQRVRLIALDTAEEMTAARNAEGFRRVYCAVTAEQAGWFARTLKSVPDGWRVVVLSHNPVERRLAWAEEYCCVFGGIVSAYNRRETFDAAVGDGRVRADFSDCGGRVILGVCGHGHRDDSLTAADGAVWCEVNCDALINNGGSPYARTEGTPSEPSFDVILIADGKICAVKYGAGEDRTFEAHIL